MHRFFSLNSLVVFLNISRFFLGAFSEDATNSQTVMESVCAPYCLKVFLWSTVNLNNKIEACDKINMQMSALQSQLSVLKLKATMYEKTIQEKENQCKNNEQLYTELSTIKSNTESIAAQTRSESEQVTKILKQLEDYKATIEQQNEQIRTLENKLQSQSNLTSSPAALILLDNKQEIKPEVFETSCLKIGNSTDIWQIQVPGIEPFPVPCDGIIAGPGWAVIQRRVDKSVDFNRSWADYRAGFGDLKGNWFIGLEKMHRMTNSQPHELFIYLENFNNEIRHAHYKNFSIGSEDEGYQLKVLGEYSGNAGDALKFNKNMKFSTFDRDNDNRDYDNCSKERQSGWWYNQCARANLNGQYFERELDKWEGIWWWNWQETRTLKSVQMLIRPNNDNLIGTIFKT